MTRLEQLQQSDAWDNAWNLPIAKAGGNPHLYAAYTALVLSMHGERLPTYAYASYLEACERDDGLFLRRPDGTFGPTSHDELIGIAHLDSFAAIEIVDYLDRNDGRYETHGPHMLHPERYNLYRFPWLRPYLAARAGYRVSLISQAIWALKLVIEAWSDRNGAKQGPGPRLRAWLMAAEMRRFPLCYIAWRFYRYMIERGGNTLRNDLMQEPAWPVLAEMAPLAYEHPRGGA